MYLAIMSKAAYRLDALSPDILQIALAHRRVMDVNIGLDLVSATKKTVSFVIWDV